MDRQPKAIVEDFLSAFSAADYESAFALTAPDAPWTVWSGQGEPETAAMHEMRGRLKHVAGLMERPIRWTASSLTAENGTVFAEISGEGRTRNGYEYHNSYAVIFRTDSKRIIGLSEMCELEPVEGLMAALQA